MRLVFLKKDNLFLSFLCLPALFFALDPEIKSYAHLIILTYFVSLAVSLKRAKYFIPSFIMYLLYSPLWLSWLGLNFLVINMVPITYLFLYIIIKNRFFISKNLMILLISIFSICILSFVFSPYSQFLLPGIINFFVVILSIFLSYVYSKTDNDTELIEKTLIAAGVTITTLIISAFFNDVNLSDFHLIGAGVIASDYKDPWYFPRGSFFYVNLFYVLGISLIICFSKILSSSSKFYDVIFFIYIFSGLIFLFNKTAFLALLPALIYCIYASRRYLSSYVILGLVFLFGLTVLAFYFYISSFEEITRIINLSSLAARISILENIIPAYNLSPFNILIGTGPDSLLRTPNDQSQFLTLLKTSENAVEGTLDSGLLSYFVEYGIFFVFTYILVMLTGIYLGLKKYSPNLDRHSFGGVTNYAGACFVYTSTCSLTQVLSIGKVAWIVAFSLAYFLIMLFKANKQTL